MRITFRQQEDCITSLEINQAASSMKQFIKNLEDIHRKNSLS